MLKSFKRFRALPLHWKILLGGQAIVFAGLIVQRYHMIQATHQKAALTKQFAERHAAEQQQKQQQQQQQHAEKK